LRWFRRKKKDEILETTEEKTPQVETTKPREQNAEVIPTPQPMEIKNPVEAFIKKLQSMISDPTFAEKSKALKPTRIQLIIGGEPIFLSKEGVTPLNLTRERSVQTDVFIRMSEEAARQLVSTSSLQEFRKQYKAMVQAKGASSFVSLKLHTPLPELRNQGYFSLELLRILIDA
jgi:hypothetical protein